MTVYFISDGEYVKIGHTTSSVLKRLKALQTGHPKALEIIKIIPGRFDLEQKIHSDLAEYRCEGEWFLFTQFVREYIDSIQTEEKIVANNIDKIKALDDSALKDLCACLKAIEDKLDYIIHEKLSDPVSRIESLPTLEKKLPSDSRQSHLLQFIEECGIVEDQKSFVPTKEVWSLLKSWYISKSILKINKNGREVWEENFTYTDEWVKSSFLLQRRLKKIFPNVFPIHKKSNRCIGGIKIDSALLPQNSLTLDPADRGHRP